MKILKEFDDPDIIDTSGGSTMRWRWGLNENGRLCRHMLIDGEPYDVWYECDGPWPNIKTMAKLVKKFGHLMVLL